MLDGREGALLAVGALAFLTFSPGVGHGLARDADTGSIEANAVSTSVGSSATASVSASTKSSAGSASAARTKAGRSATAHPDQVAPAAINVRRLIAPRPVQH